MLQMYDINESKDLLRFKIFKINTMKSLILLINELLVRNI